MDWTEKFKRAPEKPLPKLGCSIFFYVVLALIVLFFVVMYIMYKMQS